MDIKIPTLGRTVVYYPNANDPQEQYPAVVTDGDDLAPSLCVFHKYNGAEVKLSVQHKSLVENISPMPAYWDWPEVK